MFLRGGHWSRATPDKAICFDAKLCDKLGPPFANMQSVAQFGRAEQTCFVQVTCLNAHAVRAACYKAGKGRAADPATSSHAWRRRPAASSETYEDSAARLGRWWRRMHRRLHTLHRREQRGSAEAALCSLPGAEAP